MTNWSGISPDERDARIQAARPVVERIVGDGRQGTAWRRAAEETGVPYDALRRALDPIYKAQRCEAVNRARHRIDRSAIIKRQHLGDDPRTKPDEATVARLRAAIPADTGPLTARLLGDPMPGRSALDRRRPKLFAGGV